MHLVIESFYDAALDEALWPSALRNLADLTQSQAASFWVLDGSKNPRLPTFISINFDEKSIQEYLNGMAALDPTVRYLITHPQQYIVHDGLLPNARDKETRAYFDWHERSVETRFRMVGQARLASTVQAGVALHRTRKRGAYGTKDISQFALLHRHLGRALAIAFRLGSLGTFQRFGVDWLDRSSAAIVLLDDRVNLVFANRKAQELATTGDGVSLSARGPVFVRKADNDKLQTLIARVLSGVASPDDLTRTMCAPRPSGKRPYGVFVTPVSREVPVLSNFRPAVCVVITDPACNQREPTQRLQAAFGLTESEAHLAALLSQGDELRLAAEKLNITYGTARARLAQIFQKTDTARQGELIRLMLTTLLAA